MASIRYKVGRIRSSLAPFARRQVARHAMGRRKPALGGCGQTGWIANRTTGRRCLKLDEGARVRVSLYEEGSLLNLDDRRLLRGLRTKRLAINMA